MQRSNVILKTSDESRFKTAVVTGVHEKYEDLTKSESILTLLVSGENLPYIRLGAMTFFPNDLWCHPVRSTSH